MSSHQQKLLSIIEEFQRARILVLGDVLVDHYIWGTVDRVSPEAPVVVVNVKREDRRLGGAGNVLRNIVSLGAEAVLGSVVGDDEAGRGIAELLQGVGTSAAALAVDRDRPTTVKSRVIAHSQQVVRIDYERVQPLPPDVRARLSGAVEREIERVQGVVISDYGKGVVSRELVACVLPYVSKMPVLVDPKAPHFELYHGVTVVKPNRAEASQASGIAVNDRESAARAARLLLKEWGCRMVLVTLGEAGMVLVTSDDPEVPAIEVDTVAQEVFDVSGAGDTVSAVFSLSLAVGADAADAALLANCAAGIVVGEVGTVAVTADDLKNHVRMLAI